MIERLKVIQAGRTPDGTLTVMKINEIIMAVNTIRAKSENTDEQKQLKKQDQIIKNLLTRCSQKQADIDQLQEDNKKLLTDLRRERAVVDLYAAKEWKVEAEIDLAYMSVDVVREKSGLIIQDGGLLARKRILRR